LSTYLPKSIFLAPAEIDLGVKLLITVFVTVLVKQFAICLGLIQKSPKIDAKVLELVLKCIKAN
jgi:hypothetical protein